MRLDDVGAAIRPRAPWEAVDQGLAMLGRWWRPVLLAWVALVVTSTAALYVGGWERPGLAVLVIWWFKPAYDRVLLFVLSRALFGGDVRLWTVLSGLPRWFGRGLLLDLTLRRFSGTRCLDLPVNELERPRGRRGRERRRQVGEDGSARTAFGLLVAALHLEWSVAIGLLGLLWMLAPQGSLPDMMDVWAGLTTGTLSDAALRLTTICWLVGLWVCEPLYVAGGFSLYVNRRTVLEGWDVELAFRRLARRVAAELGRAARVGVLLLATGLLMSPGEPLRAGVPAVGGTPTMQARQDGPLDLEPEVDVQDSLRAVLADETFGSTRTVRIWRPDGRDRDGGAPGMGLLGPLVQVLTVGLLAVGLVFLVVALVRGIAAARRDRAPARRAPTTAFGLEITRESLPEDPAEVARRLLREGDLRGGLSLLYRAAIAILVEREHLELEESDTEHDCLRRVRGRSHDTLAGVFEDLTHAWIGCAYGRELPGLEGALELCDRWTAVFGEQSARPLAVATDSATEDPGEARP